MARTSSFSKQALVVFLSFVLHFTAFTTAYASASDLGGWTINSKIAQGSSMLINASKNVVINGANIAKTSTALIKPTVGQVSKILLRGGAGYVLSVAVEQLLGAVDWVLDPANSRISYKSAVNPGCAINSNFCKYTYDPGYSLPTAPTAEDACRSIVNYHNKRLNAVAYKYETLRAGSNVTLNGVQVPTAMCVERDIAANRTFEETMYPRSLVADDRPRDKHISIDTVAQKVIDNAETSTDDKIKTGAQTVTIGAADEALATDSATKTNVIQQLETNAKTQTNEEVKGETKPIDSAKPELGDSLSLKFPVFCSWAPTICEAAQVAISFPQTLTSWWDTSTKSITEAYELAKTKVKAVEDYFNENPQKDTDTQLDIDAVPPVDINTDINFGGSCPQSKFVPVSFAGVNTTIEFSYLWMCQLSEFLKPIVVALASYAAALIVAGIRQEND